MLRTTVAATGHARHAETLEEVIEGTVGRQAWRQAFIVAVALPDGLVRLDADGNDGRLDALHHVGKAEHRLGLGLRQVLSLSGVVEDEGGFAGDDAAESQGEN